MGNEQKSGLVADWERLERIFIRPEDEECRKTLVKYMEQILFGLHDFLENHVGVTEAISLKDLTENYQNTLINPNPEKKLAYFAAIDNVKFRKPVIPGDQLRLEVKLLNYKLSMCKMHGQAFVDGDLAAEAVMIASIVDRK